MLDSHLKFSIAFVFIAIAIGNYICSYVIIKIKGLFY